MLGYCGSVNGNFGCGCNFYQFYKPVEERNAKTLQMFLLASVMQICNLEFLEIQ
jgi:hypothetical protein